jgi:hypothetical protein
MELDWLCTGVLKVSHLCYMKGFYEAPSWVSKKALVGIRCLTINTRANRVVIVSSVITRIFLTLCNIGWSHFISTCLIMLCITLVCQLYYYCCCSTYFVVVRLIYSSLFIFCSTLFIRLFCSIQLSLLIVHWKKY